MPLADDVPVCAERNDAEDRVLRLSPVQFDSAGAAWFVAASSCIGEDGATEALYLVETRLLEAEWVLHTVDLLSGG